MSNKLESKKKISTRKQAKRFLKAKESFKKMQEEIAPFLKRREFKEHSTAGKWCNTVDLYS